MSNDNVIDLSKARPDGTLLEAVDVRTPIGMAQIAVTIMAVDLSNAGVETDLINAAVNKAFSTAMQLYIHGGIVKLTIQEPDNG